MGEQQAFVEQKQKEILFPTRLLINTSDLDMSESDTIMLLLKRGAILGENP